MANDRDDFKPEIRNSAWWASDSRKAANGRGNDVVLEKLGLKPIPDLSEVEAVQMGHVMQPIIGQLAQRKLGMELKDADYFLTHHKEKWMKSHFDFISADGKVLVEAKNYNAAVRSKFDSDANIIPTADMAQLIHEAAVHQVDRIVLAVLFGGQEFVTFDFTITEEQKENLIKDMAVFWGAIQSKSPLDPETVAQAKIMYSQDDGTSVTATDKIEKAAQVLKQIKTTIKSLEEQEEQLSTTLQSYMKLHNQIVTPDGIILATWKNRKSYRRFNQDLFKQTYPDLFNQFVFEQTGPRVFLLK